MGSLVALSFGIAACGGGSSTTTSATTPASTASVAKQGVVTIKMTIVGDPGNPSVGVQQTFAAAPENETQAGAAGVAEAQEVEAQHAALTQEAKQNGAKSTAVKPPVGPGIYKNCSKAPPAPPTCLTVGGVKYTYGIGEFEITVSQYVSFLNTVDPNGTNPHELYFSNMSPTTWAKYGSIRYSSSAGTGQHYSIAYPEWTNMPFNFTNFRRAARFVNSLTNGTVLSRTKSTSGKFQYMTYTVRLSPKTERGMYTLADRETTRTRSSGFVLPSNDEWVKAAYYDPSHGGTDSYWRYTTVPFNPPNPSKLNPGSGEVVNSSTQPLATYNPNDPNSKLDTPGSPPGAAPTWCPPQAGREACESVYPVHLPKAKYLSTYEANLSPIGEALTPSPWGTYDQGGNTVEWTDTIAPQPAGHHFLRVWRYLHGGVANAPAWQIGISAFGYIDQDNKLVDKTYPWQGFRVGVVGNLE